MVIRVGVWIVGEVKEMETIVEEFLDMKMYGVSNLLMD